MLGAYRLELLATLAAIDNIFNDYLLRLASDNPLPS